MIDHHRADVYVPVLSCFVLKRVGKGVSPISVELRPGESQESLLKRFRKAVAEARILPTVRQKRWFTSKSEIRRIKKQKAIRKAQRNRTRGPRA
jgi:small subunit ribosomal protein S21